MNRIPSSLTTAVSPSSRKVTLSARGSSAAKSLLTAASPGLWERTMPPAWPSLAAMMVLSSSPSTAATMAWEPRRCSFMDRKAASKVSPSSRPASMRCAMTSLSVSEVKAWPLACRRSLSWR